MTGALLDNRLVSVLDAHLARHFDCKPEQPPSIHKTLPPLTQIPDLMDLASEVLAGKPAAAARLRAELSLIATGRRRKGISDWAQVVTSSLPLCAEPTDDAQLPADSHPLLPIERWLHVVAATVYSARSPVELAGLLEALLDGLEGYSALTRLFDIVRASNDIEFSRIDAAYRSYQKYFDPDFLRGVASASNSNQNENTRLLHDMSHSALGTRMFAGNLDRDLIEIPPDLPPWMLDCLRESTIQLQLSGYGVAGEGYEITTVEPNTGCPGDTIILEGRGFEGVEAVEFTGADGQSVRADLESATDSRIEVVFPRDAVSGPIWLYIPERVLLCSGISSLLARPGVPGEISGGLPRINSFDFVHPGRCLFADSNPSLAWSVEPPGASVEILDHFEGDRRTLYSGNEADGYVRVPFEEAHIGEHRLEIVVRSECSYEPQSISYNIFVGAKGAPFSVAAVEVTQGIQRFSMIDLADPTNNSIDLVNGMDTVVRVYVQNDGGTASDSLITGVLRLDGIDYTPMNRNTAGEPFIRLGLSPRRSDVNGTLNFLIPAAAATGTHTAEIEVFNVDTCPIHSTTELHEISWVDYPAFPVTVLRISDPGTGDVITPAAALDTMTQAFERLPSPMTEVRFAPRPFVIHEGTTEANYCRDGGYYQLALSVAYQHNFTEGTNHSSSWIGIYFQFGCSAGGMMSWPYTSSCISQDDVETVAHEIAHTIGMGHTWELCEDVRQPVACHKPLPFPGLNTEVVFDIRGNRVRLNTPDLQSYRAGFRFLRPELWEMTRRLMTDRY